MAYKLGDLVVRITGDNADFKKKIGETKKEADVTGKSVGKSFDLMKVKTLALGVAGTAVFVKTIGFLKDSAMAAINAQETFSKFDVVFAGMGGAAETAAQQFIDSFDLAEETAKRMLSSTGDLLTGMGATKDVALEMSLQVNSLASDLASFTNYSGGAEGAADALTKALLGERESVKSLGIVIREEDVQNRLAAAGKDKLTGAAMLQAKAEATLQIAMEQSKNAIGDYARTSESAANTLKRAGEETKSLQVAVGTLLMPSVADLADVWGKVSGAIADVITKSNELREARRTEGTEEDTLENELKRRQALRAELQSTINTYKVYDEEGKLVRTAALEAAEAEMAANEATIKSLEIRIRQTAILENQNIKAKKTVEDWNETNEKAHTEEEQRLQAIADSRKAIYDNFLAQTAELNWQTEQGLITEKEERDGIAEALRNQINSLYELYVQTGDESLIMGEQMMGAIAHLGELENVAGRVTDKMELDFTSVKENGIKNTLAGLSTLSEALAAGELTWKSFAGSALGALAAVLEAIAAEIAALAAVNIARDWFNPAVWAANAYLLGQAAAAYVSAGLVRASAGNFAGGGIVEPRPGTGTIVNVAENGSGEVLFNTGDSGQAFIQQMGAAIAANIEMTAIFQTESEKLAEIVVRPINDGKVRLNR
jgi:hypothetical protein